MRKNVRWTRRAVKAGTREGARPAAIGSKTREGARSVAVKAETRVGIRPAAVSFPKPPALAAAIAVVFLVLSAYPAAGAAPSATPTPHELMVHAQPDTSSPGSGNPYRSSGSVAGETITDTGYLNQALAEMAAGMEGDYGIYFHIPASGEEAGYQADKEFYAASCYKLFLVMYIYERAASGQVSLDECLTYTEGDYEGGSGSLQYMAFGTRVSVRELCRLAISQSDNVAANMLRHRFGYAAYRNYAASLGCPVSGRMDGRNLTTARELGALLHRVLDFAAENPLGKEVIGFMRESDLRTRIPAGVLPEVPVANKTGDYEGYFNDMAIVFTKEVPYVLVVLSHGAFGDEGHVRISGFLHTYLSYRLASGERGLANLETIEGDLFFSGCRTDSGFQEWFCLTNNGKEASRVSMELTAVQGGTIRFSGLEVPAGSCVTVNLNCVAGQTGLSFIRLRTDEGPTVIAKKPSYALSEGGWRERAASRNAVRPSRLWFLSGTEAPEASRERLAVFNPSDRASEVTVRTWAAETLDIKRYLLVVEAGATVTLDLEPPAPGEAYPSIHVLADAPIVVERY